jgi:uncharacterized protein YuzE
MTAHDSSVRITCDPDADAAYVAIAEPIGPGEACTQIWVHSKRIRGGDIILDLDRDGRLLGVEVLGATTLLRPDTLAAAVLLTD